MLLPTGSHVAVIDGERFVLLRNDGPAANPSLAVVDTPELEVTNYSQGKLRHSITTAQHRGEDLAEGAHVAAAAEWLNHAVLTNRIEQLLVIADKRSLGELRRYWHKELERRLIGELPKALATRPVPEIEQAITAA